MKYYSPFHSNLHILWREISDFMIENCYDKTYYRRSNEWIMSVIEILQYVSRIAATPSSAP